MGDPVTSTAAVAGVGQAVGNQLSGKPSSGEKPNPDAYYDPYADDMRARLLGVIDGYMKKRGLDALIPAENRPYEYRTPEERQRIAEYRQQIRDSAYNKPMGIDDRVPKKERDVETPKEATAPSSEDLTPRAPKAERIQVDEGDTGEGINRYLHAGMAAAARRKEMGLSPKVTAPKKFALLDPATQAAEQERVLRFVRGGRNG